RAAQGVGQAAEGSDPDAARALRPGLRLSVRSRGDITVRPVLTPGELVRPRSLAALSGVVGELVTDVGEALEVVGAREVRAEPVVRSGALAFRVRAGALEILRAQVSARGRLLPAAEGRAGFAVEGPADAGRDRG